MSEQVIVSPMTDDEARLCISEINVLMGRIRVRQQQLEDDERDARRKILDLYTRQGWQVLGYVSFLDCAKKEFGKSFQHVYRLKDAAQIDENLQQVSPTGEIPKQIPERHARELTKLKTPEEQHEAYQKASQIAAAEGDTRVTAEHVAQAVQQVQAKARVFQSKYFVISHMVARDEVTAQVAEQMVTAIDKLKPRTRGQLMELIAKHGLTCAELIPLLGERFERQTADDPSRLLQTLLATGTLAGTALRRANMTDWQRAVKEAQSERIGEKEAGQPVVYTALVTLYPNDLERSREAIRKELGIVWLAALAESVLNNG